MSTIPKTLNFSFYQIQHFYYSCNSAGVLKSAFSLTYQVNSRRCIKCQLESISLLGFEEQAL